jgi:hypothetical protein
VELAVLIHPEPNGYGHRNYCAEGAIAILLSTGADAVLSLDVISVAAHVVQSYGTTGTNAVVAINSYLEQISGYSRYAYASTHTTSLAIFEQQLETQLSRLGRLAAAGHGRRVLVHVMTATLPVWKGYQSQQMIAVTGYDFSVGAGEPTPSPTWRAPARWPATDGPEMRTISLAALWTEMQDYIADVTGDPVTVIS